MSKISYTFTFHELAPVAHVELENDLGIQFWYQGEDPRRMPVQYVEIDEGMPPEEVMRPRLTENKTIQMYRTKGKEAVIRHLNVRIVTYLIKTLEKQRNELPEGITAVIQDRIDRFHTWFWKQAEQTGEKIPIVIEKYVNERRDQPTRVWYTLKQAAGYSGQSESQLRKAIRDGLLKATRQTPDIEKSTYLIHRKNLDAYNLFHSNKLNVFQKRELDWLSSGID